MAKLLTPANVLLAFSALCTFAGLLGLFFSQAYLDLISVNPVVASPREIVLFQLAGTVCIALAAAACGLHKHPTQFALRSLGTGVLLHLAFEVYVWTLKIFHDWAIAKWFVPHACFAVYFLTYKSHGASSSSSPARSPARGRGRKSA